MRSGRVGVLIGVLASAVLAVACAAAPAGPQPMAPAAATITPPPVPHVAAVAPVPTPRPVPLGSPADLPGGARAGRPAPVAPPAPVAQQGAPAGPGGGQQANPQGQAPAGAPNPQPADGYGCAAALAYLAANAAPGFTFECPGNAWGHQAMTCVDHAPQCPGSRIIAIAVPCAAAYQNEASNSWVLLGLRQGVIDPYGYCH